MVASHTPIPNWGTWTATQACVLTENQTGDPLVCRLVLNSLSHTSQGCPVLFLLLSLDSLSVPLFIQYLVPGRQHYFPPCRHCGKINNEDVYSKEISSYLDLLCFTEFHFYPTQPPILMKISCHHPELFLL